MPRALLNFTAQTGDRAAALRRMQSSLRSRWGWDVSLSAETEVVETVTLERIDVVLLDLSAPRTAGVELLEAIRERKPDQPVILLTGKITRRTHTILEQAVDLGAVDFFELPERAARAADEVVLRLRALLQRSGSRQKGRWQLANDPQPNPIQPSLPELHDPGTGRIDARRIADYLGITLKELSEALGEKYATVHKTPASERLQPGLRRLKRILEILASYLSARVDILAWLNSPHPDLDEEEPLDLMLTGEGEAVRTLLENTLLGHPA